MDPVTRATSDLIGGFGASIGVAGAAGELGGFFWGGIGGRVAMRVLFLTSDAHVKGLTSDDGFEIGRISADSLFLLVFLTIFGAMLGAGYGFLRMCLRGRRWVVAVGFTVAAGATSGALIVRPDGVDFVFLEPLWLAVSLFVFLPAAWAATVVLLTDWLLHRPGFSEIPEAVDARPFGLPGSVVAWAGLALLTVWSVIGLVDDVRQLR